jgi:hypothetical protein
VDNQEDLKETKMTFHLTNLLIALGLACLAILVLLS